MGKIVAIAFAALLIAIGGVWTLQGLGYLKGSSMTMGARRLGSLCKEMETHADRHPGDAVTSALVTELDREFARVRDALEAERQGGTQI